MILQGDCLEVLRTLKTGSVHLCITSPPFYGLRNYGVDGQIGLEQTPNEYITKLCDVFDEVHRVLRNDGSCLVNLGDSYSDKSLIGIPARFQIEMLDRGWILRNVIIWHKPGCMPSSVKDRYTIDYEYLFFFVKQPKYYFKQQLEPYQSEYNTYEYNGTAQKDYASSKAQNPSDSKRRILESMKKNGGRNKRCVWSINTASFKEAHFAVYPEKLIESPIDACCPVGGVVLDCFFGAGTTGVVAKKQKKDFIGIELNQEYIEIAQKRIDEIQEVI